MVQMQKVVGEAQGLEQYSSRWLAWVGWRDEGGKKGIFRYLAISKRVTLVDRNMKSKTRFQNLFDLSNSIITSHEASSAAAASVITAISNGSLLSQHQQQIRQSSNLGEAKIIWPNIKGSKVGDCLSSQRQRSATKRITR